MKNNLHPPSEPSNLQGCPIIFRSRQHRRSLTHWLLTGLLLVGLSTLSWGQQCFNTSTIPLTPTTNPVANPPFAEAAGDFNGDGKPDLAVVGAYTPSVVSVLLNTGSGSFGPAVNYELGFGFQPTDIAVTDINGDGKPDLAVTGIGGNNVAVLLNTGNGTFGAATFYGVGTMPQSIAVGDFNADGKPDLATANQSSTNVSVLLNLGNGIVSAATNFTTSGSPSSIVAGDFNSDGKTDLVVANLLGAISFLPGMGNGAFGPFVYTPLTNLFFVPRQMKTGDFNGDGKPDLALIGNTDNIQILLGNGAGGFGFAPATGSGGGRNGLTVGDFNGDGKADLASTAYSAPTVFIQLGNGNGTFQAATSITVGASPSAILSADFNGDGKLDLSVINGGANVSVLLGKGDGTFGMAGTVMNPISVAVADFNRDGKPDMAVASFNSNNVSVLLNNGSGGFGAATVFMAGSSPTSVAVGDFNKDGNPDLAVTNQTSNNISILLGTGTGNFGMAPNVSLSSSKPQTVAVGDVNGDGNPDLLTANVGSGALSDYSIALGDGNGSFGAAKNFSAGYSYSGIAVGDFNGDAYTDFVTTDYIHSRVAVFVSNGTGDISSYQNFGVGDTPVSVAVGDFNADGKADLATANLNSNNVSILLGAGNGTFGVATNYPANSNPYSIVTGDFNSDGKLDLAVTNSTPDKISILTGNGSGGFGAAASFPVGNNPLSAAVGDFNGDGKPDLVTANNDSNDASLLLNCTATANTPPTVAIAIPNQSGTVGQAFNYTIPANTFTDAETPGSLTLSASGLPAGLSLMGTTISGTPSASGVSTVTIKATDPDGLFVNATFTITINPTGVTPPPPPASLTITSFNCFSTAGALSSVNFVVGYSGGTFTPALPNLFINGITITGQLGQTYTFGFDGNQSLLPIQDQATRSTYFIWNFRAACAGGGTPPVAMAPVAPSLPNQTATMGTFFSYAVPAFTGSTPITYAAAGLPGGLSFDAATRIISGTPTGTGVSTVMITATNAAGMGSGSFTITVNAPVTPPSTPGSLTITNFTCQYTAGALSSVNFVVGYSGGSFTPALPNLFINGVTITGQLGQTYTFGFDGNQSFLPIQDQASRSTYFVWNFRQACPASGVRLGAEPVTPWQAQLLGNPVSNEVGVVIRDAQGQSLQLQLTNLAGYVIETRPIQPTSPEHKEVFDVQRQGGGLLFLQAVGDDHRQTLKILKQ